MSIKFLSLKDNIKYIEFKKYIKKEHIVKYGAYELFFDMFVKTNMNLNGFPFDIDDNSKNKNELEAIYYDLNFLQNIRGLIEYRVEFKPEFAKFISYQEYTQGNFIKLKLTESGEELRNWLVNNSVSEEELKYAILFYEDQCMTKETNPNSIDSNSNKNKDIFIGMHYHNDHFPHEAAIKQAIEKAGFTPKMVKNEVWASNYTIDDKIIKLMNECQLGVFDFSFLGDAGINIGAVFECGYMMGKGKKIINICEEEDLPNLHFDLNHRDILKFSKNNFGDLVDKLTERIKALSERTINKKKQ